MDIPHDPWEIALSECAIVLDITVYCPINIGLKHIGILTKYPNFHQPILIKQSKESNRFVINSVDNFLKDFEVNVSHSTHHINVNNNYLSLVVLLPLYAVINNLVFILKQDLIITLPLGEMANLCQELTEVSLMRIVLRQKYIDHFFVMALSLDIRMLLIKIICT